MKTLIYYCKVLKIFFKKYFIQIIRECRDEIMYGFGTLCLMAAGVMLFFFGLLGLMMIPTAFYCYVAIMASLAFAGIIIRAIFADYKKADENNENG